MLKETNLEKTLSKDEYKAKSKLWEERLPLLQQELKAAGVPVILVFEGFGAAGKGSLISDLMAYLDPRGFKVYNIGEPTVEEARRPFLWRYWTKIPEKGRMSIFDRSWYRDVTVDIVDRKERDKEAEEGCLPKSKAMLPDMYADLRIFERQLADGGYCIIKFFLHISKGEQKKRFKRLEADKTTAWRVTARDWKHHKRYKDYRRIFDCMIEETDRPWAPWTVIPSTDRRYAASVIFDTVIGRCAKAARALREGKSVSYAPPFAVSPRLLTHPPLSQVDLGARLSEKAYRRELEEEQKRLAENQSLLYLRKIPMVLAYEGWDAAGKGGNIKRVSRALDSRGYEVIPVSSPLPPEKNRHYLYRFWLPLPKTGHTVIYDRTWYGRVLVERVEGLCPEADWRRAYGEINEFEYQLTKSGAILLKFWLHIGKETQLVRFDERSATPEKRWKITDEDWRNREKWGEYEKAVNEMLASTSTGYAPWTIVESDDKYYARVKALRTINKAVEARLGAAESRLGGD